MKKIIQKFRIIIPVIIILLSASCSKDDPIPASEIPSIETIEPSEGSVGTELTITGSNFQSGANVYVDAIAAESVEVSSSTIIYATVPTGIPGNVLLSVTVINPGGGEDTFESAFTAIDPEITFINSATKPSGNAGSTVIIEGRAFGDRQGESKVFFSDGEEGTIEATISSDEDWTDEFIITTVPNESKDGPVTVQTEIGTSNEVDFTITDAAIFSPSTINWTVTTPLPLAVSGHKAVPVSIESETVTERYVHVLGGRNAEGVPANQAVYGQIKTDGTIDSWANTTSLPEPLAFHTSVVATPFNSKVESNGFIYVLGGINTDSEAVSSVQFAAINNDGTLQSWSNTIDLPEALHSAGAVLFRNTIYVVGGATSDNTPVASVYMANINDNGQLDEWQTLPSLPVAVAYHELVSFGGYLYSVGGETGIANPDADSQVEAIDKVYYSRINLRTGEIDEWLLNPNTLQKTRSKHTALVLGGNMFVSSGLYSGLSPNVPGSSENVYANIKSDGIVEGFNGATGSNTLFSAGGSNLFNQSGISYIDADGVAHVMIIGGARYGSPNTKLDNVLFY